MFTCVWGGGGTVDREMGTLSPGSYSGGRGVVMVPPRVEVTHDDSCSVGGLEVVEDSVLGSVLGIGEWVGVMPAGLV